MVMSRMPKPRRVLTRRSFLRWAGYGTLGTVLAASGYARFVEPWWIDYSHHTIPIRGLPAAFDGLRIAHLTDLHYNPVSLDEIAGWVDKVNHLGADLVALTGDFITGGHKTDIREVADVLRPLTAPLGVVACLGNHDYGTPYPNARRDHLSHGARAREALERAGIEVLVNGFTVRRRAGQALHLAGLGDLWTSDFRADALIDAPGRPLVVLAHNPDTLYSIEPHAPRRGRPAEPHHFDLMLSGHTHGGQVKFPFLGPPRLPIRHRHLAEGRFEYRGAQIYVSRGLGYLTPVRFRARPEMGIIELKCA